MLIDTREWDAGPAPEHEPEPEGRHSFPHVPWRPLAWIAAFICLLGLAAEVDGFAGYGVFLLAIALGSWRLERWAGRWEVGRPGDSGAWY
jgi:hypothetical protein